MTVPHKNQSQYFEQFLFTELSKKEIKQFAQEHAQPYQELMAYYRCAMMEVSTKFNVLNEELSLQYDRNPIESIKARLKSPESILEKIQRKKILPTVDNIEKSINDIAGVRVICSFQSDIYMLADTFLKQDDIQLIQKKDYIRNPKDNGYRSLHLIIEIPIFLHDKKKMMKVEVQFRTMSMDWWASLEHKIRYKKDFVNIGQAEKELYDCAKISDELDRRMEQIYKEIECSLCNTVKEIAL